MNLRHTYNTKPTSNSEEEYYIEGWAVIEPEVLRLQNIAWEYLEIGKQDLADRYNQAANQHIYLFYYALFLRNWLDQRGFDTTCSSELLNCNFKILCVEKNLQCLSNDFDTDYMSVWEQLLQIFNINRQVDGCETECCLGIGEMIIEHPDDCIAFIIGPCDENEPPVPPYGEFNACEFTQDEFTQPIGDGIYDDCN